VTVWVIYLGGHRPHARLLYERRAHRSIWLSHVIWWYYGTIRIV